MDVSVVTPPTMTVEEVQVRQPFVTRLVNRILGRPGSHTFCGRVGFSNMMIASSDDLTVGLRFDLDSGDRKYVGGMPIGREFGTNLYECTVDHFL